MAPPSETRTVRIAADLADEKIRWMGHFGWALTGREERPYAGDVLVEREIALRAVASDFTTVAVLRFERTASPALTEAEAEFWSPTLVPDGVFTALALLRWVVFALVFLGVQWIVLLYTVDYGSDAAVRVGLRGFVAPIVGVAALALTGFVAGTLWVRRVQRDPAARERRLRARQAWAVERAAAIRGV